MVETQTIELALYSEGEEHILLGELRAAGIEASLEGELARYTYEASVRVRVPAPKVGEARAVLENFYRARHLSHRIEAGEPIVCFECESQSVQVVRRPPDSLLARILYNLINGAHRAQVRCDACGYKRWVTW